ncbi:hypothetical protein [Deinococcus puniceus]|uniref:Uncharacterized protein n=1 Tax=Deinococcus puniceus TaxID=1182568 RepID=A0A172T6Q5_9DEIO|nr:hypothetical protein [Deinococcus puniceus]ANE42725.1 hypothetical protein SU48_01955 [Deinococcus puniceus]
MKKTLSLTLLLATLASGAQAATLAQNMPAGALLTLESKNAGGAIDRLFGLVGQVAESVGEGSDDVADLTQTLTGFQQILKGSLGKEGALGVFTVGAPGKPFDLHVLAASRTDELSDEMLGQMLPDKPGANVGLYSFSRQGRMFVGQSQGLVYMSSNKTLLMNYLGRLSGNTAPRLLNSAAYTAPTAAKGEQELSFFVNFSAAAKVARSQFARFFLPRLLSPIVDAVDTLGQYSAGFTTTDAGLTGQAAHAVNLEGKDKPLTRMLTSTTNFAVQNIIPANAETVAARACAPESNAYAARWLTRIDLIDPVGFLTDSQLASHLERSARYLGNECAQVALDGAQAAGFDAANPLSALDYSVTYQRVTDLSAAEAHMPEYAQAVNTAIAGLAQSLGDLVKNTDMGDLAGLGGMDDFPAGAQAGALASALGGVGELTELLGKVQMVYNFRDGYLITAYSQAALDAAMAEDAPLLAADADFVAAALKTQGAAGWQYARNPADVTEEQMMGVFANALADAGMADADTEGMTEEERADLEEMQDSMAGIFEPVGTVLTDLINRYDGLTAQSSVSGNLIVSKSNVKFTW